MKPGAITLDSLFDLQNRAVDYNLSHSSGLQVRLGFVRDAVALGGALDPISAELALALPPDISMQLLDALEDAYRQDGIQFPEAERLVRLVEDYEGLPEVKVPDTEKST